MKSIVITGATRGIGYGMAHEFLQRGHQVTICGRSQQSVDKAVQSLSEHHDASHIIGQPCDVSQYEDVQALWDTAIAQFNQVDIWINNAGVDTKRETLDVLDLAAIDTTLDVNLRGVFYGSRVALQGMMTQGHGMIYNMEGLGSEGRMSKGALIYGTTKYGMTYFTKALAKEMQDTPVKILLLSPGMVVTDLLLGDYEGEDLERAKRFFNILADKVETVTPWLVEQILQNDGSRERIAWLTRPKIFARFLSTPFRKRDLFSD
ncbi:MAG: SDR family NAD(P)-dependent oxidoreductase [Aggregatilineales bacterium]